MTSRPVQGFPSPEGDWAEHRQPRPLAGENVAPFITHRLPFPNIRTVTIGVRRGVAVAGGKCTTR